MPVDGERRIPCHAERQMPAGDERLRGDLPVRSTESVAADIPQTRPS